MLAVLATLLTTVLALGANEVPALGKPGRNTTTTSTSTSTSTTTTLPRPATEMTVDPPVVLYVLPGLSAYCGLSACTSWTQLVSARLTGADGIPLADKPIGFSGWAPYGDGGCSASTNSAGVAECILTTYGEPAQFVWAGFAGDAEHAPSEGWWPWRL